MLFLTIPYDKGWTAEVDGEKAEVLEAGDTFVALNLSAGTHEIKLRYVSPGFKYGLLGSILCWGIFFLLSMVWKKRRKLSLPEYGEKKASDAADAGAGDQGSVEVTPEEEAPEEEVFEEAAPENGDPDREQTGGEAEEAEILEAETEKAETGESENAAAEDADPE